MPLVFIMLATKSCTILNCSIFSCKGTVHFCLRLSVSKLNFSQFTSLHPSSLYTPLHPFTTLQGSLQNWKMANKGVWGSGQNHSFESSRKNDISKRSEGSSGASMFFKFAFLGKFLPLTDDRWPFDRNADLQVILCIFFGGTFHPCFWLLQAHLS